LNRRTLLAGAAGAAAGAVLGYAGRGWLGLLGPPSEAPLVVPGTLGIPGPYPGRVVEVHHPAAATGNRRNRQAVRQMVERGMCALVGCDHPVEAWRRFFAPGDRVGIKVVPVGRPDSISSPELVLEVIDGLRSAGVRPSDILVFDRYRDEFMSCGYHQILPEGVHWECASVRYDDLQVWIDGQIPGEPRQKRVSGYDPQVYREVAYCLPQHDPSDDRRFRSHLCRIVSEKVDKFISLPVLKDHRSAGVTLSLKNLSHGSVNNVARSHIITGQPGKIERGKTLNQCGTFIPAIVSLPAIRQKAVLQILDGLVGTWEGGPGTWNRTFATWNYNSLFFATDPVALDHVGWEVIDRKRAAEGWPGVAQMGLEGHWRPIDVNGRSVPSEQFHMRQPEHVALAATLGLGVFERKAIRHERIDLPAESAVQERA